MDAPIAALAAQLAQESDFRADAKSPFASGLSQFTTATSIWISSLYPQLGSPAPLDPQWAIRAMILYDKRLHDGINPAVDECSRYSFALSDYNGGSGWRIKRQKMSPQPGVYAITSAFNPGISKANQQQNQDYPFRIIYHWQPIFVSWSGPMVCLPKTGN